MVEFTLPWFVMSIQICHCERTDPRGAERLGAGLFRSQPKCQIFRISLKAGPSVVVAVPERKGGIGTPNDDGFGGWASLGLDIRVESWAWSQKAVSIHSSQPLIFGPGIALNLDSGG
jgi:hypothetical protein